MNSDIDIARAANKKPISEIASTLNIPLEHITPYGHDKAKINLEYIKSLNNKADGKLILVTAISPTAAGEGKTTTTVGLGDGLNRIGKQTVICLREPSLGPCFGMKGGAAGGGMAQVVPMEDINLHFTGDFHAIGAAHNLLAALIDNHIHWGNSLGIDSRRIAFKRVIDMNDRSLRELAIGLGGPGNGYSRTDGFDITVASEIMAIFCLATDAKDLQERIGNIVVAETRDRKPIRARELDADGAMATLLKDAINPNLVQTLENNPALIHGGPFANIAHGCNSVIATKAALKLGDYIVTEAGFGADLGAEKFFDIKCRKANLKPAASVVVATVRALKMHGGVDKASLTKENVAAVKKGCDNLIRHIQNIHSFGVPVIVAINQFTNDTQAEIDIIKNVTEALGVEAILSNHWQEGSAGSEKLAKKVVDLIDQNRSQFSPIYELNQPILNKIDIIAKNIYSAKEVNADKQILEKLKYFEQQGYGNLPVCIAKTQYSFSTDVSLLGAPSGHSINIREVRLAAGAEFIVVVCGNIMTMPGLPKTPAANQIHIDDSGLIQGLF